MSRKFRAPTIWEGDHLTNGRSLFPLQGCRLTIGRQARATPAKPQTYGEAGTGLWTMNSIFAATLTCSSVVFFTTPPLSSSLAPIDSAEQRAKRRIISHLSAPTRDPRAFRRLVANPATVPALQNFEIHHQIQIHSQFQPSGISSPQIFNTSTISILH